MSNEQEQGGGEDSPVIRQIREQNRALKRAVREAEQKAEQAVELAKAQLAFESEYQATGLPESVKHLIESEMDDGESIVEVAERLQLNSLAQRDPEPTPTPEESSVAADLQAVANLGSQIAQAATGGGNNSLMDKINSAETPEALAQVMREAEGS